MIMANQTKPETPSDVRSVVRQRYGKMAEKQQTESQADCCAPTQSSCCGPEDAAEINLVSQLYEDPEVDELPSEVTDLSLGCGDPVTLASLKPGQTVLDLGSGGGIDCFLAAKRVGPTGKVIGVDMTAEMIERARANKTKLGAENVEFRLGEIEHLPTADESVDVIISNCVINLSPDKPQVFREAFRALKPGGRLAVSDIVTDGPLPDVIKNNLAAWAGCVAGALDVNEYIAAIRDAGFVDVELIPVYWDKDTVDAAVDQLDLDKEALAGKPVMVVQEGSGVEVIELEADVKLDQESLSKSIFSAKISAHKPK
jgi:ubiquinone/menaquinone biosynthesis C-methylase UbiE